MLELLNNQLVFRFPEIHPTAALTITLHRTLRIPDDGKNYPLPPSLGSFPVVHVDDFKEKVSPKWVGRGGVMLPMFQSEALWMAFHPSICPERGVPFQFAIKCATGKVSALTGKTWSKKLKADDYMVSPGQPWLDGYVVADGTVRQFVAAPLGLGVTAEGQITGKEEFGGIQLEVLPMLMEIFEKKFPKIEQQTRGNIIRARGLRSTGVTGPTGPCGPSGPVGSGWHGALPGVYSNVVKDGATMDSYISLSAVPAAAGACNYSSDSINVLSLEESMAKRPEIYSPQFSTESLSLNCSDEVLESSAPNVQLDMGLAAGGRMTQQVFKDPHGIECWDSKNKTRVYIHLANSIGWQHVTGTLPPHPPMSAADYTKHGYAWFDYYEENTKSLKGTEALQGVKSLVQLQQEKKLPLLAENQSTTVKPQQTVKLKTKKNQVRDGVWK